METTIWLNGSYRNVKPTDTVNTSRAVESFCNYNRLRKCLVRQQGGWYKLELNGILTFVTRALYLITFEQLYNTLKD